MSATATRTTVQWLATTLLGLALTISPPGFAQSEDANGQAGGGTGDESTAAQSTLETKLELIAKQEAELSRLNGIRTRAEGLDQKLLDTRISRLLDRLIALVHATAQSVVDERDEDGTEVSAPDERVTSSVTALTAQIEKQLDYIQGMLKLPEPEQSAMEQSALIADLEAAALAHDKLIDALIANNAIAAKLGMETSASEASVSKEVARGAENASIYLDVVMLQLQKLRRQLTTLPNNEELTARISVTEKHMQSVANILRKRAARMSALGLDSSEINAQLIAATGAITADIFDMGVVSGITSKFFDGVMNWIADNGARITFQALIFVIILGLTWKAARLGEIVATRALGTMKVRLTQLLQRMIVSAVRSVILVLGLLIGLSQLGISLGPLLAGLGIAGFIIGFALQDSLSNFASGLMILIYRPFDVGDVVDVNGAFGTVRHMSLVNTTVLTFDNQTLVVPNNQVWQNIIKNLTNQTTRRVDLVFGISYADDIEKTERILSEIVDANEKILDDPAPIVRLHELADSSVNFVVRPWVKTEDYWETYWSLTREVKMRFDQEGISIPFPQRDVHLFTQQETTEK